MTARRGELARRLAQLSEARRDLLQLWLQRAGALPSRARLMAAIRAPEDLDVQALREHLLDRVPEYMVPQRIVVLDDLPRTAAGKIDRRALATACAAPAPAPADTAQDAPRNDAEATLAAIWADVLGFEDIDVHDDFFEVGGDSLLSIRILSRAGKAGLAISPEDFFAHPTIAGQASIARTAGAQPVRRAATGPLPLLPIQQWFFRAITVHPEHWNQSLLFTLDAPVTAEHITRAVNALVARHDALRSAFSRNSEGQWQARIEAPTGYDIVRAVDLRDADPEERDRRIAAQADRTNAGLDLDSAPLIRAVYFRCAQDEPDRLLLVAHHLIVDAQSWAILVDDLQSLCRQLLDGRPPDLAGPSTSINDWAQRLAQLAESADLATAAEWWKDTLRGPFAQPLTLHGHAGTDTEADRGTVRVALTGAQTAAIARHVATALRVTVEEALLGALGRTLAGRCKGGGALRIDVEGHGREAVFDDLDPSHGVGWFTSLYPVVLPGANDSAWAGPRAAAAAAKQALRSVPLNGLSHGLLWARGADDPALRAIRSAPQAQVLFNYLGRTASPEPDALLRLADARCGRARHLDCPRPFPLEINASIENEHLVAELAYGRSRIGDEAAAAIAADFAVQMRALIAAAQDAEGASATPSDFPLAGLDQGELDDLSDLLDDMDT